MTFNINFFNKKCFYTEFFTGAYSVPGRASRMELSACGFEPLIGFLETGAVWDFSGGSEYDSGLTNDFLLFFFIPWNVPFKSAGKCLWQISLLEACVV